MHFTKSLPQILHLLRKNDAVLSQLSIAFLEHLIKGFGVS